MGDSFKAPVFRWGRDKVKNYIVILSCLLMLFLHLFAPERESLISLGIIIASLFYSVDLPVCLYICSILLQVEFENFHTRMLLLFISGVLLYVFFQKNFIKKVLPIAVPCLLLLIFSLFSTFLGYQTSMIGFMFVVIQLLLIMVISFYCMQSSSIFMVGFVVSGLCIGLYVFYQYITGHASMFYGSLVYGDGEEAGLVKSLAIGVVVPTYFFLYNFFFKNESVKNKMIYLFLITLCVAVIVLTYSRGVLIALAVALSFLLWNYYKWKLSLFNTLKIISVVVLLYYLIVQLDLDVEKMFANIEGAHGRTDIWDFYFTKLKEGGFMRILFGFGPGDSKRITEGSLYSGYYSHSAILDYLFSLGLFGLCFIAYAIYTAAMRLYRKRYFFSLGFLILIILMFSTHGTATNAIFNSLLAICIGKSLSKSDLDVNSIRNRKRKRLTIQ